MTYSQTMTRSLAAEEGVSSARRIVKTKTQKQLKGNMSEQSTEQNKPQTPDLEPKKDATGGGGAGKTNVPAKQTN